MDGAGADTKDLGPAADKAKAGTRHRRKAGGIGLRTKMVLLFILIPLMLTAGMSFFYVWQFETTSHLLVQESSKINAQLAEKKIANISAATAMLQSRAKALTDKVRMIALMMLGATLLIMGIIVFAYAHRLTGKIKSLTEVAERISLGDLEMEIETRSRDEIGELAEAIARIQDNFRHSIERLRLRR
jgi:methyl-accepting chemotaxis protein